MMNDENKRGQDSGGRGQALGKRWKRGRAEERKKQKRRGEEEKKRRKNIL
jgi:hypothetical protein